MKEFHEITVFASEGPFPGYFDSVVSPETFAALAKADPSAVSDCGGTPMFRCRLPPECDVLHGITRILSDHGYSPKPPIAKCKPGQYWVIIYREYSDVDLEAAAYFIPTIDNWYSNCGKDRNPESGHLGLSRNSAIARGLLGSLFWWLVASKDFRRLAAKAGLLHMAYVPIDIVGKGGRVLAPFRDHWELTSDLVLPPLSRECVLKTNKDEPFSGDYTNGCHLIEGNYFIAELHYEASALRRVEPFDLALTREQFGNGPPALAPQYVASQRFYRFCMDCGIQIAGRVVRVDES